MSGNSEHLLCAGAVALCSPLADEELRRERHTSWPSTQPVPVGSLRSCLHHIFISICPEGRGRLGDLLEDGTADAISVGHFLFLQWP